MKKGGWSGPVWRASLVGMTAALVAAHVPESGPARDARDASQTPAEAPEGVVVWSQEGDGGPQNGSQRRSWWRRFFGL